MKPPFGWLNPEKALIVRIVHKDNVSGILDGGIPCSRRSAASSGYVDIGDRKLIDKRGHRNVPIPPGGTLADYVPFYFTPYSVMLFNIVTGRGVKRRSNDEIVMLVTDLHRIVDSGLKFLFTDAHAYTGLANFYDDLSELHRIDWRSLQYRDFRRDPEDPRRLDRYLAEALVHEHVPVSAIRGIVCHDPLLEGALKAEVARRGLDLPVHLLQWWYFR